MAEITSEGETRNGEFSNLLDVYIWSNYPEVNSFVDEIYTEHFLDVNRNDVDSVIRKKWIMLNKQHHPDNLIAKGMPQEFIDQANEELSSINLAYDKIKEFRGIS